MRTLTERECERQCDKALKWQNERCRLLHTFVRAFCKRILFDFGDCIMLNHTLCHKYLAQSVHHTHSHRHTRTHTHTEMHRQTTRTVAKTNAGDAAKRNCTQRQRRHFATASCLLLPFPILFLVLAGDVVVVVSVDDDASMASACLPLCIVLGAHALCLFILPPKAVLDELSWGSDWGRGLWLWGVRAGVCGWQH